MLDISKSTNDELIERLDYCGYDPYYNDLRQEVIAEIKLRMGRYDIVECDDTDDLISRKALLEAYDKAHQGPPGGARKLIEEAPGATKKTGRWIFYFDDKSGRDGYKCSECGSAQPWYYDYFEHFEFCPHCGAKMSD